LPTLTGASLVGGDSVAARPETALGVIFLVILAFLVVKAVGSTPA